MVIVEALGNKAVFMHIPKTAGMWVKTVLQPIIIESTGNTTASFAPKDINRYTFVRNPFDWYISWFTFFNLAKVNLNPVLAGIGEYKDFKKVVMSLLEPDSDTKRRIVSLNLKSAFDKTGANPNQVANWLDGESYYSSLVRQYTYGCTRVGKTETVRADLLSMLSESNIYNQAVDIRINHTNPVNVSKHNASMSYYDSEMIEAIKLHDRLVFTTYYPDIL